MHGEKRAKRLIAAKTKMRRKVHTLKKRAGIGSERDQRQGCDQEQDEIMRLLLQLSSAKWTLFLKELSGGGSPVMEDFY